MYDSGLMIAGARAREYEQFGFVILASIKIAIAIATASNKRGVSSQPQVRWQNRKYLQLYVMLHQ
jgi:hypothetical protein